TKAPRYQPSTHIETSAQNAAVNPANPARQVEITRVW
ncbi:MAG: hypothetical protein ACI8R4_003036, partial [Paracoccaceae bacterium]